MLMLLLASCRRTSRESGHHDDWPGVVLGVAIGLVLLFWVVNLIRQDRLYVGYGVIFVFGTLAAMTVLIVPPLLDAVTRASVALLPVPSLSIVRARACSRS